MGDSTTLMDYLDRENVLHQLLPMQMLELWQKGGGIRIGDLRAHLGDQGDGPGFHHMAQKFGPLMLEGGICTIVTPEVCPLYVET